MRNLPYWLALCRISVLGARRIRTLTDVFGSAEKALTASVEALVAAGLPAKAASVMAEERKFIDPVKELHRLESLGISAVLTADAHYPQRLREIFDPPAVLFYQGDLSVLAECCVAVVGSRNATEYGKTTAARLSGDLAARGVTVISGMARGIDTAAHHGTLRNGGRTAAVLGSGLDVCYPPENRKLRDAIIRQGVVISEFPPGTQPKPHHFPMRNRIISGLSQTVVVVEAAERSGALITADCALEQGRDVFAVPGSINSPASRGCHRLIKEGAGVAESAADILAALGLSVPAAGRCEEPDLSPLQKKVLLHLEYEPVHFDEITLRSGLSAPETAVLLVQLEIGGFVAKLPGNYYLRV